jgi:hypothetical protein
MLIRPSLLILFLAAIMPACNNEEETGSTRNVNPERIYFDYVITAEEGSESVTCRLQYKLGGKNGPALLLDSPGRVEMDGRVLAPDSAKYTGAYYEIDTTLSAFTGRHTIVYTASDGRQYREEFEFRPFTLAAELPERVKREDLVIRLKNFPFRETPVRLVLTDTSFGTTWINETIGVVNGELVITRQMLEGLRSGPIGLEIYREEERRLRQRTRQGGRISITYGLKREFELLD